MTSPLEAFLHVPRIAYFSMEIALRAEIPSFSGGLGGLAGRLFPAAPVKGDDRGGQS